MKNRDDFPFGIEVVLLEDYDFTWEKRAHPFDGQLPAGSSGVVVEWPPKDAAPLRNYAPAPVDCVLVNFGRPGQTWIPVSKLDYANPLDRLARRT